MAKTKKRGIGDDGEELACKFLSKAGHTVVERNYWRPWGEIDIVSEKGNVLHFIEVKSVSRELGEDAAPAGESPLGGVRPEENMHEAKLRRLHRAIQTYLLEKRVSDNKLWQIDLACVYIDFQNKKAKVEMLENIVL